MMGCKKHFKDLCINNNFNFCTSFQKNNNWSVKIYTGYINTYKKIFYADGFLTEKKVIKRAILFLENMPIVCGRCSGSGTVQQRYIDGLGLPDSETVECEKCQGKGTLCMNS